MCICVCIRCCLFCEIKKLFSVRSLAKLELVS